MANSCTTNHREAAAYHAAGHAVMALYEKVPFSDVSIAQCGASLPADPDLRGPASPDSVFEESVSQNLAIPYEASTDVLDCVLFKKKVLRVRSLVKIAFAGVVAEQLFTGRREPARMRAATKRASRLGRALHPHPIMCRRYLIATVAEVQDLLRPVPEWGQSPWEQIFAIAEKLLINESLTVAEVRQVIADQCCAPSSAPCLPTAECLAAEWLESEIDAVADPPDVVKAFNSHKYGAVDRLFPKEELNAIHDRLKNGDMTAVVVWNAYFKVMVSLSAGAALRKLPSEQWHDGRWDEYFQAGSLEALKEARKLMDEPTFVMRQPEHYTWKAIKHAIAEIAWLDRRYARVHKGYDYIAAKGDPSHLPPVETERKYALTLNVVADACEFDFEEEVLRLLRKFNGDEDRVAKLLGRAVHVIRGVRHYVEERALRQKRSVFKIDPSHTIEPVSLDSTPLMKLEFEEIKVCCETELEESIIDLMYEHWDEATVASILGLKLVKVMNMLGAIGAVYAGRMKDQGAAMPIFEKEMDTLTRYRPKNKQANDWPREKPLSVKAMRQSRDTSIER